MKTILLLLFFLVVLDSCKIMDEANNALFSDKAQQNNEEADSSNKEGYQLQYKYKKGTEKKYKNEIQVHFSSIKINGLAKKTQASLLALNKNQKFKDIFFILSQKNSVKIHNVDSKGQANIEIKTLEVILEDLMINKELSGMGTPMIVPIEEDNKLQYKASKLGSMVQLDTDLNKNIGLEKSIYNKLISVLDKIQPLTDKKIAKGESWKQSVKESIDISSVFPKSYKANAIYNIQFDLDQSLNKAEKSEFYIGQKYKGRIELNLDSIFGKGMMTLNFKGKGERVINNEIGFDEKETQESQFDIQFQFDTDKKYKALLGNPDIKIKGTLVKNHSLIEEDSKK